MNTPEQPLTLPDRPNPSLLGAPRSFSLVMALLAALLASATSAHSGLKGVGTGLDPINSYSTPPHLPAAINNLQGSHGITWWYNWAYEKRGSQGNGDYIPMVWGYWEWNDFLSQLNTAATTSGASAVLTFNEPEFDFQSGLTVDEVMALWPTIQNACRANGKRIGSPAVGDGPESDAWLDNFMAQLNANGYEVDFLSVHPYQKGPDPTAAKDKLVNRLAKIYDKHRKPIWVTEIALADWSQTNPYYDQATQATFARLVINALETLPYVERYAWYQAAPSESVNGITAYGLATCTSSGALTQVGTSWRDNWGTGNWFGNPGLESAYSTWSPWQVWSPNGTASAAYMGKNEPPAAHTGMYYGAIARSTPHFAVVYQNVTGLPGGSYTVGAWVKSSGGQANCRMYVKKHANANGSDELSYWIPTTSTWTWIQIPNIPVSTGNIEIGFLQSTSSNGNRWMNFDDVAIWKN